jgi:hypothetical protein
MNKNISVNGITIAVTTKDAGNFISLTDMTKNFEGGSSLIENWLRNKNTVEFLGVWERIHNPNFNSVEFDGIMMQVGLNRFKLSAKKWIEKTNASGLIAKAGKYGGTFAHKDIAFHFGMWLSPEFNLLVLKEFQRLEEQERLSLKSQEWLHRRFLSKANYRVQTDAIKQHLIPKMNLPKDREGLVYAREAEILNLAVFGITSRDWAEANPERVMNGENIRDGASVPELIALSNSEVLNKELISQNLPEEKRLEILRKSALETIASLENSPTVKKLKDSN